MCFRIKMHYNEVKFTQRTAFCQKMTDRWLRAASMQLISFKYHLVPISAGVGTEFGHRISTLLHPSSSNVATETAVE